MIMIITPIENNHPLRTFIVSTPSYIIEIYELRKYQCNKVKLNTNSYWVGYLVVYVRQRRDVSWLSGETENLE